MLTAILLDLVLLNRLYLVHLPLVPTNTTNDGFKGYSLYNRIVRKYFRANKSTNGGWFWGKVKLYSPNTGLYTIEYEDDDEENFIEIK
jgi:hypothetical protein